MSKNSGPRTGSKEGWRMVESYFSQKYRLSEHQLESFDTFVFSKIPLTIRDANPFIMKKTEGQRDIEVRVYVGGKSSDRIFYTKPTISIDGGDFEPLVPSICRNMGSVYDFEISADVTVETDDLKTGKTTTTEFERVVLARVPTMLHSSLCYLRNRPPEALVELGEDPAEEGGYFVVDGKEKVIIAQEQVAPNNVILRPKGDGMQVFFRSVRMESSLKPVEFEIYTKSPTDRRVYANVRAISREIPLAVLFRLLGYESDRDIALAILGSRMEGDNPREKMILGVLRESLADNSGVWTRAEAVEFVRPHTPYKTVDQVLFIAQRHVVPGAGAAASMKGLELGRLSRRLLEGVLGLAESIDRESFMIKQVQVSGELLAEVFSDSYAVFKKTFRDDLDKAFYFGPWNQSGRIDLILNNSNIPKFMRATVITDTIYKSMKGNWGGRFNPEEAGIVQDLNRVSYIGALSHIRRLNNPLNRDIKLLAPHRLHGSQWGSLCPVESPDGASVGLLKNLAIMCRVTADEDPATVISFIESLKVARADSAPIGEAVAMSKVLVNGVWVFSSDDPAGLLKLAREARREGKFSRLVSVSYDFHADEIHFYSNAGRCARPLFVAGKDPKKTPATWGEMLDKGFVEYIDVRESENIMVAMGIDEIGPRHTHAELHPSTIFSVYSVTVPLLSHNPGNRNTLSAAQGKQAASLFNAAFRLRADAMAFCLDYPERPLVSTKYETLLGVDSHPQGHNAVVAIMVFTGYNQEDAVILNASSVERGFFKTSYFKSAVHREETGADSRVYFGSPFQVDGVSVDSVDENGFPIENSYVQEGDTLVGTIAELYEDLDATAAAEPEGLLVSNSNRGKRKIVKNVSPAADSTWRGTVVDNVVVNTASGTTEGAPVRTCRVRYRKTRFPEVGDKFASRHAQKGVLGLVIPESEMPYTSDGVVPDVIINPHGFPSRMTIGHLLESIFAKGAAVSGSRVDATMFEDPDLESTKASLEGAGFNRMGEEILYSPATGLPMSGSVFLAPTYYQRLKHMSQDKVKARQSGRVSAISRQPTGTVGSEKPLKLGEMETWGMMGHGASMFFNESSMVKSDRTGAWFDSGGELISYNERNGRFVGIRDENDTVFVKHQIPYAFNVLKHETETLGIGMSVGRAPGEEKRSEDSIEGE
jgi:DNA-directed RNA polymerase II subunit RPB2